MSFSQDAILHLNIDTGSSSTRGFFLADFDGGTHEGFIHQPPNVGFLMQSNYENEKGRSTPKTSRVTFRQGSEWVFRIVGEIPGHAGTKTDPNMSKADLLLPKVLAFVGLGLDRVPKLSPDRVKLAINFMLPISEWTEYADLESDLLSCLLGGFGYNGRHIDFAAVDAKGYMEGAGMATIPPPDITAYIGVCGHKDANFIAVEDGRPLAYPKSKTFEGLGMSSIVNSVMHFTDDVQGAKAVFRFLALMDNPRKQDQARKELAALIKPHRLEQKLAQTKEGFNKNWGEIKQRIDSDRGIKQAQAFYLVGGNAPIYKSRFKALFGSAFKPINGAIAQLTDEFEEINAQWAFRAIDIWMLHLHVTGRTWTAKGVKEYAQAK